MPQRQAKSFMYDPADERALNRLSAHGGDRDWNFMNWFVLLAAKKDLTSLSQGDFLNLQEETVAIRRTFCKDYRAKPPTKEELSRLQNDIGKYLHDLVVRHDVTLGPFPVTIEINLPTRKAEQDSREEGWISRMVGSTGRLPSLLPKISVWHRVSHDQSLLYEFARRLETYAEAIRRCPHCSTIFLQMRPTAIYCGRTCQSRAVMKKLRAEAKAMAQSKKAKRRGRTASIKGGKRHGK